MKTDKSVIKAAEALVDDWLDIEPKGIPPCYRHRSAALQLTRRQAPIQGTEEFLEAAYSQIHDTWLKARESGYSNPSDQNWRWKRHEDTKDTNKSPEVLLERAIVKHCGLHWSNQVPVASGLVGPAMDKRAAIDLVRQYGTDAYDFIELKVDSNNPLFAAIEIVIYGLVFVWSKTNQEALGYNAKKNPILNASSVTFMVLAPSDFYRDLDLSHLGRSLNNGLSRFGDTHGIALAFRFCQFPESSTRNIAKFEGSIRPVWEEDSTS